MRIEDPLPLAVDGAGTVVADLARLAGPSGQWASLWPAALKRAASASHSSLSGSVLKARVQPGQDDPVSDVVADAVALFTPLGLTIANSTIAKMLSKAQVSNRTMNGVVRPVV